MSEDTVNTDMQREWVSDDPNGWRHIYLTYVDDSGQAARARLDERLPLFIDGRTDLFWRFRPALERQVDFEKDCTLWRASARLSCTHGLVRDRDADVWVPYGMASP